MGQVFHVICKTCKVERDLDKFYALVPANTRAEVMRVAERIESTHAYRAALLVSFMAEHRGHDCTIIEDGYDAEDYEGYTEETSDFWNTSPHEAQQQ